MSHPAPHWYRILFTNAKTHMVQGAMRTALILEMTSRGCPINDHFEKAYPAATGYKAIKRVRSYGLDTGGMCRVDEPWVGFKIDNLPINFPCTGVLSFHLAAKKLEERRFDSGAPYYKVHGNLHCMVFNPRCFKTFLAELERLVPIAEQTATVFFADKPSPIQVLRDSQAKAFGVAPESLGPVEAFGNSTADRFIPRERGKA